MLRCSIGSELRRASSSLHHLERVAYRASHPPACTESFSHLHSAKRHGRQVACPAALHRYASQSAPTRAAQAVEAVDTESLTSTYPAPSLALADRVLRTANLFGARSSRGQLLSRVHARLEEDLAAIQPGRRIAIIGSEAAGTASLVTALLDDPLVLAENDDKGEALDALRSRLLGSAASGGLRGSRIRYGPTPSLRFPLPSEVSGPFDSLPIVQLPLPWLRDSKLEIFELLNISASHDTNLDYLHELDALILVADSYTLSQPSLASSTPTAAILSRFASKPGTRLLANQVTLTPFDSSAALTSLHSHSAGLFERFKAQVSQYGADAPIVRVSTADAEAAVVALRLALSTADPRADSTSDTRQVTASAALWDSFRTLHRTSNLSTVGEILGSTHASPQLSALFALQCAISDAEAILSAETEVVRRVEAQCALLRASVEKGIEEQSARLRDRAVVQEHAPLHASAPSSGILARLRSLTSSAPPNAAEVPEDEVDPPPALSTRSQLTYILDERLSWHRLLAWWRADNVYAEVERAVQRSWGSAERGADGTTAGGREWLIFEAARLQAHADRQYEQAVSALDQLARSEELGNAREIDALGSAAPLASQLLRNAIETHAPRHARGTFGPLTLIRPYSLRLSQIVAPGGPLSDLSARAHRVVLQAYLLAGTSFGVAGTGAALHEGLLSSLPGVAEGETLQMLALQPGSAVAIALIGALGAVRRVQSGWSGAKKRWWRAWERVEGGLEADLENTFEETLRRRVYAAPSVLADGLEEWVKRRRVMLEEVTAKVAVLKAGLEER